MILLLHHQHEQYTSPGLGILSSNKGKIPTKLYKLTYANTYNEIPGQLIFF